MPILSSQQFNELPEWIRVPYQQMVRNATAAMDEAPPIYGGNRVAEIPEEIQAAHKLASENLGSELPMFGAALESLEKGATPFHRVHREYMNPYQQEVVRQIAEEGNRNFRENVLPALEAKFVRLGQHGGSRHMDLSLRAARDLQHEILNRQQQALASGYQQAAQIYNAQQARNLEAAQQLGNLAAGQQGSRLADVAALENVGRYRQQQQQATEDIRYQDWLRQLEHPTYRMNQLSAIMQGIPAQGINQAYYQTPATPQMNIMGQMGPLALGILGMRNALGGGR